MQYFWLIKIIYWTISLIILFNFNNLKFILGDCKVSFLEKAKFLLASSLGYWLLINHIKIYLIFGMTLASFVAILISIGIENNSDEKIELSIASTLSLCFMCIIFWVQIISFNYIVAKKIKMPI
jgi:hypothetical protein